MSPSGRVDPDETITLSVYGEPVPVETPTAPGTESSTGNDKGGDKAKAKGKK